MGPVDDYVTTKPTTPKYKVQRVEQRPRDSEEFLIGESWATFAMTSDVVGIHLPESLSGACR
jgi:hypothetical protein